jgi:hypothetical protein
MQQQFSNTNTQKTYEVVIPQNKISIILKLEENETFNTEECRITHLYKYINSKRIELTELELQNNQNNIIQVKTFVPILNKNTKLYEQEEITFDIPKSWLVEKIDREVQIEEFINNILKELTYHNFILFYLEEKPDFVLTKFDKTNLDLLDIANNKYEKNDLIYIIAKDGTKVERDLKRFLKNKLKNILLEKNPNIETKPLTNIYSFIEEIHKYYIFNKNLTNGGSYAGNITGWLNEEPKLKNYESFIKLNKTFRIK